MPIPIRFPEQAGALSLPPDSLASFAVNCKASNVLAQYDPEGKTRVRSFLMHLCWPGSLFASHKGIPEPGSGINEF